MRRAHEHGVSNALFFDIVDEPAASANKGVVLDAGVGSVVMGRSIHAEIRLISGPGRRL
jgi:hypothetical protein